jgi:cytochrome c
MLPHPQINPDEANLMVRWILSLEPGKAAPAMNRGLRGEISVPNERRLRGGVIEAAYTDGGKGNVGPLGAVAKVRLLSRRLQAESGSVKGARILSGENSQDGFVGSIDHSHQVDFGKLQLSTSGSLTARVSSGGQGGTIEFRDGSPSGPLVASVEVKPTGAWGNWVELNAPLRIKAPVDLVAVFVNPGKGGLMNLDWVQFNP